MKVRQQGVCRDAVKCVHSDVCDDADVVPYMGVW